MIMLAVSLFFNREGWLEKEYLERQAEESARVRDSLINAGISKVQAEADDHHRRADSLQAYVVNYEKADSINRYNIKHAKAKIRNYTPSQRNSAIDSILRSAGIQNGTR